MVESNAEPTMEQASAPGRPRRTARGTSSAWPDEGEASFRDVRQSLQDGRWTIAGALAISLAAAGAYLFLAPPVYRAAALVKVEGRAEGDRRLEDLSALLAPRATAAAEAELLRSRLVVGTALDRLGLDVQARPHRLPLLGEAIARHRAAASPTAPPLNAGWLARFAWGGEKLAVRSMRVPDHLVDRPLTLTALAGGRYRISGEDGATLLEGEVERPASAEVAGGRIEILVATLAARPGTRFDLEKIGRPRLLERTLHSLTVAERGTGSGMLSISYEAGDPQEAAAVVSAIGTAYLEQDAQMIREEAGRTLAFLDAQLPQLETRLDLAETALERYRERRGTVDLPLEARAAVDRTLELDRLVDELEVTRAQLVHKYTARHPDVRLVERQIAAAQAERDALRSRKMDMPQTQLGSARLTRDVGTAEDLVLTLRKRAQELRVVKAGPAASARVIDWPVTPHRPVRPVPGLVLGLGLMLGLGCGVAAALGRRAMDHNAEDPRDVEDGTGLPVYVTIPHSEREVRLQRSAGRGGRVPLALAAPDDPATEVLRTLRTALAFVLKARGKIVAVSSPSPGVGKSFVCANLAQLVAAAGQRVLLVDADLRQGRLHRYFSAEQSPGLSDVLRGEATLEEVVKGTGTAGLEILPRGEPAHTPAELLARPRLAEILATAAARYDVVLVDTPPILPVTDALLVSRSASVNLLVLRARQHAVPEIADALELFARSGVPVHGGILNDARPGRGYARAYPRRAAATERTGGAGHVAS